jgi:hypothetical protein
MPKPKNIYLILVLIAIMIPCAAEGTGLKIERMSIYFNNDRPEITVKRNYPLKAYVEIGYSGYGLLIGQWEVDGEFLTHVNMTISSGYRVIIESPDIPQIPTFVSGTHRIRLVITNPSPGLSFPTAIYFVTTDEWKGDSK